ncbi:peptidoglycan-associated lipoprotein Pal [Croceibacterium mercuriale]|nr:peptidoglycan-associated lipoprotein Pal [Croceibacterium mercuriale]
MQKLVLALAAVSTMGLAACSKKAPEELPPPPQQTTPTPPPATTAPGAAAPGTQAHFQQTMRGQDTIYFDTDKYDVDSQDQAALRQQAQYLTQYAQVRATVEGHADERGTRDYNLALGERRANAARNYLVSLGIPANRITTVSYGKERPKAVGSNEAAYAQNRRAVTVVIN